jgi:uncharacterized membrane protein YjfL (UPF0719 family)
MVHMLADVDLSGRFSSALSSMGASAAYAALGLVVFGVAFWIMCRLAPFSVRKEIEEDQNVALGIVIGAVILGIALIVAATIHGA